MLRLLRPRIGVPSALAHLYAHSAGMENLPKSQDVLDFWFADLDEKGFRKLWYQKNAEFDEQIQCLFQPFTQGSKHVTREYGGTGLGLAISHRLATMLEASLTVKSEQGVGSVFKLELPKQLCEPTPEWP